MDGGSHGTLSSTGLLGVKSGPRLRLPGGLAGLQVERRKSIGSNGLGDKSPTQPGLSLDWLAIRRLGWDSRGLVLRG